MDQAGLTGANSSRPQHFEEFVLGARLASNSLLIHVYEINKIRYPQAISRVYKINMPSKGLSVRLK